MKGTEMDKGKGKGNPGARPQYARDIHGLRSSNAAGTHADGRERRARTRGAAKARAVREDGC